MVNGLILALNSILDDQKFIKQEQEKDEMNEVEPDGYQFRSSSSSWQDNIAHGPVKGDKIFEGIVKELKNEANDKKANQQVHQSLKNIVLKNMYR